MLYYCVTKNNNVFTNDKIGQFGGTGTMIVSHQVIKSGYDHPLKPYFWKLL